MSLAYDSKSDTEFQSIEPIHNCKHKQTKTFTSEVTNKKVTICALCGVHIHTSVDELPGGSTPSQYALPPGASELQDLIEHREMNFAMGNIFKACYRKKDVGDPLYDIRKIIWFAKREEARLMKEEK